VAAIGCLGINEGGFKILVWQFDNEHFNSRLMPADVFYKWIFMQIGIGLWLSWLATILALISTAGIFPDLITSGSIDLFISKPISRLRLFLTEYLAGLLFVTLQVAVFSLASFLVIGIRGGAWEPGLLVTIPLMVCFFSYLFAVCVLLGVLTRSTVAALLLTLLFWFFVFAVGTAENGLLMFKTVRKHGVNLAAPPAESTDSKPEVPGSPGPAQAAEKAETAKPAEESSPATGDQSDDNNLLDVAHRVLFGVKTVLPKTTETIALLQRVLIDLAQLPRPPEQPNNAQQRRMRAAGEEMAETLRSRSLTWIVGTSLGFEAFVLACAAFVFCRRSY
jgi:hypothetical protein